MKKVLFQKKSEEHLQGSDFGDFENQPNETMKLACSG